MPEKNKILYSNDLEYLNYNLARGLFLRFLLNYFIPVVIRADSWNAVLPLPDNCVAFSCNCRATLSNSNGALAMISRPSGCFL